MKKGFTLIELLAVIVILAIIALIATPIVLNIINDAKSSATLRSTKSYLDGVEQSIAKQSIDNGSAYRPKICVIQSNGDLICDGKDKLVVEIKGEKPSSGKIVFEEGKIENILISLGNDTVSKNEEGKLIQFKSEYEIGDEVKFNPGDGDKTWNVIDEDGTTVTLMITSNFGNSVDWYASYNNNYGPKDALNYLNNLTLNWTNVDPIKNYIYINNLNGNQKTSGYQKIEIKDGNIKLTHKDGLTLTEIAGIAKARLLTVEEIFDIGIKSNANLTEENLTAYIERNLGSINAKLGKSFTSVDEVIANVVSFMKGESKHFKLYFVVGVLVYNYGIESTYDILLPEYMYQNLFSEDNISTGYWTLTSSESSLSAWIVTSSGRVFSGDSDYSPWYGVRPIITILKSKLK